MSCVQFIAESFAVRTAAHCLHLTSTSFAQHQALGEFYTPLTDLIDKYAEVYMGLEGRIAGFPAVTPPKTKPVDLLEDYLTSIKDELSEDHGSEALRNILAEIEELTARTLYKVQTLK